MKGNVITFIENDEALASLDIVEIEIISKTYGIRYAYVDFDDWYNLRLMDYTWGISKNKNNYYATTHIKIDGKDTKKYLHQFILPNNPIDKPMINHIDLNGLNNCRSNLEYCDCQYNLLNARKRGNVYWNKQNQKWVVRVSINGKMEYFRCYNSKQEGIDELTKLGLWRRK